MKGLFIMATLFSAAAAQTTGFDGDATGALPAGWRAGVTGRGSPLRSNADALED